MNRTPCDSPIKTPKRSVALALHEAVHQIDLKAVVTLLEAGANPNMQADALQGCGALHVACLMHGQACHSHCQRDAERLNAIAAVLLNHGARVDLRDHQYRMPAALADGFPPKCVREAMATKALAEPGVFAPSCIGAGSGSWLMRGHPLTKTEPLGGGPLFLSDRITHPEQVEFYEEKDRRKQHYWEHVLANAERANAEELAFGRAALGRMGLRMEVLV